MSVPENANSEELRVLSVIHEAKALLLRQLAFLCFDDDTEECYNVVSTLAQQDLVTLRPAKDYHPHKIVTLTRAGMERLGYTDIPRHMLQTNHPARIDRIVARNEVYCLLLRAGIKAEHIIPKAQAAIDLKADARFTTFDWLVKSADGQWLVYYRPTFVRANHAVTANKFHGIRGHILCYPKEDILRRDMRFFAEKTLPARFHLITTDELDTVKKLICCPEQHLAEIRKHLEAISPRGQLVKLPSECPFEYVWQGPKGGRLIIADLTTRNLGAVTATLGYNPSYSMHREWGNALALVTNNARETLMYLKLIGYKSWLWNIRLDLLPYEAVYHITDRGLEPYAIVTT